MVKLQKYEKKGLKKIATKLAFEYYLRDDASYNYYDHDIDYDEYNNITNDAFEKIKELRVFIEYIIFGEKLSPNIEYSKENIELYKNILEECMKLGKLRAKNINMIKKIREAEKLKNELITFDDKYSELVTLRKLGIDIDSYTARGNIGTLDKNAE